jgi:hypothetical protein
MEPEAERTDRPLPEPSPAAAVAIADGAPAPLWRGQPPSAPARSICQRPSSPSSLTLSN